MRAGKGSVRKRVFFGDCSSKVNLCKPFPQEQGNCSSCGTFPLKLVGHLRQQKHGCNSLYKDIIQLKGIDREGTGMLLDTSVL